MSSSWNLRSSLLIITLFILISTIYVGINLTSSSHQLNMKENFTDSRFIPSAFNIDGNLSVGEWDNAEHKIKWFINAS
ncbi:MAG: hypothetical protein ACXAEF_12220, partial [Candidatus Thorarchaeota archaeon]